MKARQIARMIFFGKSPNAPYTFADLVAQKKTRQQHERETAHTVYRLTYIWPQIHSRMMFDGFGFKIKGAGNFGIT